MADTIKINILYGSIKIVPTYKIDGETVYFGSYAIHFDMDGRETSRTNNSWTGVMTNVPLYCLPLIDGERI
jgi:hypothetical protein